MTTSEAERPAPVADCCRVCGDLVNEVYRSELPVCASSACVPVFHTARVVTCIQCGLMQKVETDLIADYLNYDLFDNDPAADKVIRSAGRPDRTRSQFVADVLLGHLPADCKGKRVLEVGCHRGPFLSALRSREPELELHGFDLDPDYARWVEPICGEGHYHCRRLEDLPGEFDACVLIHTLEHIPAPIDVLQTVRRLLAPDGILLVVVPDAFANPVDLLTIDHTCHFGAIQLRETLARAGFAGTVNADLISNELLAIARPELNDHVANHSLAPIPTDGIQALKRFERNLLKLSGEKYHVLGTAIVGAVVSGLLGDRCVGFVDEAPFRVGKLFLGRPVRLPQAVQGEAILLGVAEGPAEHLQERLTNAGLCVINPWTEPFT